MSTLVFHLSTPLTGDALLARRKEIETQLRPLGVDLLLHDGTDVIYLVDHPGNATQRKSKQGKQTL